MSQGTWRMVDRQSPRHAPGVVPEAWRHQARAPELLDEHGYAPAAACR